MRPPIVWDGQTEDDEDRVVACLEGRGVFDTVVYIPSAAKGGFADTRSYILSKRVTLHFDHAARDIDRIFVRADRELSRAEKDGLSDCARYPDFPL